jgi:ADP-ribose pyrophosphatase
MSGSQATGQPDGIVFDGARFRVRVRTLDQPVGGVRRFEIIEAPDAAAVVPLLLDQGEPRVVLVRQERPVIGRQTREIPAGLVDRRGESPEQAALRELREETGYAATALRPLARIHTSPGILTEGIQLYLATDLTPRGPPPGPQDPGEIAGLDVLPLAEALAMIARGEIDDAKTITGLLLAREALAREGAQRGPTPGSGGSAMPIDPTNAPQSMIPGPAAGPAAGGGAPDPAALSLENILTQEFGYANVTAYQAMEDRARLFGLYLTLVGVLAAALGAVSQLGGNFSKEFLLPVAAFLLLLAGLLGRIFFLQLIRVRQAWRGSALAMTRIKEYYIERLRPTVPDIDRAFMWRLATLPAGEKRGTITYLVCYTTAIIGSLSTGLAFFIAGVYATNRGWIDDLARALGLGTAPSWLDGASYVAFLALSAIAFAVFLRQQTSYYSQQLGAKKEQQQILAQEQALDGASS